MTSLTNIEQCEIGEGTAVSVEEFIKQNPTVKMIMPATPKSDYKEIGYVKSEQMDSFNLAEYSTVTPFEYARQAGVQMIIPNLEAYKYILQKENLPPTCNLPMTEETVGEFEYDSNESKFLHRPQRTLLVGIVAGTGRNDKP